jgi:succinate-semialdehyde dehydrogenase/glutarate-semialdehyde dehydrogenase
MAHEYPTELQLHIDGERLGGAGRATHRVINPATGEALGELPLATAEDLDRALDTAERGYRLWRGRPAADRSRARGCSAIVASAHRKDRRRRHDGRRQAAR